MKLKVFALSVALLAGTLSANAENAKKNCKDVFIGIGGGVISTFTPNFSTPAFYGNLMVGGHITPVWAVRGVFAGPFQTLDSFKGNAIDIINGTNVPRAYKNKLFGEINLDVMFNFSNLIAKDLAKFDVYLFAGPTMNFSSVGTKFIDQQPMSPNEYELVETSDALQVRFGATAGLGLALNCTKSFTLALEGRVGVTPSVFGDADVYRKNSGTGRLTLNAIWNIGGKTGKVARAACAAAAAGYYSKDAVDAMIADALEKNPKIKEVVKEKVVEKIVEKTVYQPSVSSTAVFFTIGKSEISAADKARLDIFADSIKNMEGTFTVSGYADKATGSSKLNQTLSEKRAQAVYDYLVSKGVPESRLEKAAYGGVDPMFQNSNALSRTTIVRSK